MRLFGNTDIGNRRGSNQDTYRYNTVSDDFVWSMVLDGMGGVNGGDIASNTAAQVIEDILLKELDPEMNATQIRETMEKAVKEANSAVFSKSVDFPELRGMGTTVVLAVVKGDKVHIVHVGDSRAYFVSPSCEMQITEDHSFVQNLVNHGEITREQARTHPRKNIITRSLGAHSMIECDYCQMHFPRNDILLLCSDGLSDYLVDGVLKDFVGRVSPESLCDELIAYALDCGGRDNITVTTVVSD